MAGNDSPLPDHRRPHLAVLERASELMAEEMAARAGRGSRGPVVVELHHILSAAQVADGTNFLTRIVVGAGNA
jgi:hypothetical protein